MNDFCHSYRIPYKQWLTIYKTVIRSQLEYGAQIIFYQNQRSIDHLDKLQLHALRILLDIPATVPDAAILFIALMNFNLTCLSVSKTHPYFMWSISQRTITNQPLSKNVLQ